jgi:anaerobic magnesium-protoporphyrin IX monomethyl ester cyclase
MERIALVIPPSCFLADERVFVHLGILKVAACLEKSGYPVDVLDLSGISNYQEVVTNYFQNSDARTIGITATTSQMPQIEIIYKTIKVVKPESTVILGGPHPTVVNAAKKREEKQGIIGRAHRAYLRLFSVADRVVAGDGEEAIFVAIQPDAPKLIDADDPESRLFLNGERLEELPFPARHLVDIHSYRYSIDNIPATSLIMQLGCVFQCGYCSGRFSPTFRRVRTRTINSVLNEVKEIYLRYGFMALQFYDDEMNLDRNFAKNMNGLTALQEQLGVRFLLRGFIKANLFTEEQATAMSEAGFRQICIGFESGSPQILKNIRKSSTLEDNTRCMEIAHRHGLKVKAFMSLGHPGENYLSIEETHKWLLDVEPEDFDCTIITPYPGTPYYDLAVQIDGHKNVWTYKAANGDKLHAKDVDFVSDSSYYKGIADGGYRSFVWTDYLTSEDLVKMRDWLERDIRQRLGIPFYPVTPSSKFDSSMGQLPGYIYKGTDSG